MMTPLLQNATHWSEIRRHARLWRACFKLALVRESQFRANFATTVTIGLMQIAIGLVPVLILFNYTSEVDGWSRADAIVLLGIFQIAAGLIAMLLSRNMYEISDAITRGMLDVVLVRPVNAQFYLTTRWVRPDQSFNVFAGIAIVVVGLAQAETFPSPTHFIQSGILILAGFLLITACWSCLAYCAFWIQSVDAMMMFFQDLLQVGRYPIAFFPVTIRVFFTALVPVAFLTTFPAEALTSGISWWLVLGALGFAVFALVLTRWFWSFAVRRYSGASS